MSRELEVYLTCFGTHNPGLTTELARTSLSDVLHSFDQRRDFARRTPESRLLDLKSRNTPALIPPYGVQSLMRKGDTSGGIWEPNKRAHELARTPIEIGDFGGFSPKYLKDRSKGAGVVCS